MTLDLQQQRAETQRSLEESKRGIVWLSILRADFDGRYLRDCDANRNIVFGWLNPGEDYPTVELLNSIFKERPQAKQELIWADPPPSPQQKQEAEQSDREAFTAFVKQNRYGDNVANFTLAREVLGHGNVTVYGLTQAVQNNAFRLAPATPKELEDRETERIQQEQSRLRNLSTRELKEEVSAGFESKRKVFRQVEADRSFAAKEQQDKQMGYEPLPEYFRGRKLDREFFIKFATRDDLRFLNQKYGPANVEARLRGIR